MAVSQPNEVLSRLPSTRQYLVTFAVISGLALGTHVILTWLFGVSPSTSSRIVGFYFGFMILVMSPGFVVRLLPESTRHWLSRNIKIEDSSEKVARLTAELARRDPDAPDFSKYDVKPTRHDKVPTPIALCFAILLLFSFFIPGAVLLLFSFGFCIALVLPFISSRSWSRVAGHTVQYEEDELLQLSPEGDVVGRIALRKPFTYEYLDKGAGSAIYQLRQEGQRLAFTSEAPLARYIVTDLLHAEWPPRDRLTM